MSSLATAPAASYDRVLTLQGGCNFRDIGGYRTADGRHVRWGKVFRAGVLSYVTAGDHASLGALGIRTICDLRRAEERSNEPTRWPDATARTLHWDDESDVQSLRKYAARQPATGAGMFAAMLELYRGLPLRMSARVRGLLNCIVEDHLPIVVHCAAGKDRTGVAIAVLLSALGVPRDTVVEDYLLTNDVGNFEVFIRGREDAQLGLADAKHPLLTMPEEIRRVAFSADPAFLSAAFEAIDELGGIEGYVHEVLGLDVAMREVLRKRLLA
jgi:protein-tyrosine phosphatase